MSEILYPTESIHLCKSNPVVDNNTVNGFKIRIDRQMESADQT